MSPPGMDAGRDRPLDANLAKALSHPLRRRILERMEREGESSPKELARGLDAPLGNVAYHVHILERLGLVELVRTRQRRGALEHHYRALAPAWLDDDQWAQLPASFRRTTLAHTLRELVSDASDAGAAGGFDHRDARIQRLRLELDDTGWGEVACVLDQCMTALQQIQADSAARVSPRTGAGPPIAAEVAVLHFRHPPQST
jgi:DNA-binding transcriptional ArsR family regulator